MASDDYAPVVRGGLKLKGASKPPGITKKKKKREKSSLSTSAEPSESKKSALQKALEEEDSELKDNKDEVELSEEQLRELVERDPNDGKTAAERAMEEMRKKRVSALSFPLSLLKFPSSFLFWGGGEQVLMVLIWLVKRTSPKRRRENT